jgi:hypothetical protein
MMMPQSMPMQAPLSYPAPAFAPQTNLPPAVPASAPRAAAPAPARPLVRAKAPDEPTPARPARLTMPSPEQLGVAVRPAANGPDWSAIHTRMKELGVVSFHMDAMPDGRSRFTCWVPGGQPGLTQRIEAVAATETESVRLGLERAGQSRAPHP